MRTSLAITLALITPLALAAPTLYDAPTRMHLPLHKKGIHIRDMEPDDRLAALIDSQRRTRHKYGLPFDEDDVEQKMAKRGDIPMGGITLAYFASIVVGTPPYNYEVVLDTGSSDLVLGTEVSNLCGSTCTVSARLYAPDQSSTAKNLGVPVSITYGTADANGTLWSDQITFGGYTDVGNITAASTANALTGYSDEAGLLGLAWNTISASNSIPFVQKLWQDGKLAEPLFSFAMADLNAYDQPNPNEVVSGGILTIGGTNSSFYTGNINYVSLIDSGSYWNLALDDIGVNGQSLGIAYAGGATIDSGTNTIALPEEAADYIYQQIPGAAIYSRSSGLYTFPCNSSVQLALAFGNQTYTMKAKDFNFGVLAHSSTDCLGAVTSNGNSPAAEQTWIIGSPFLMSFYNVYRFDPPSVGLAAIADPNSELENVPIPRSNGTATHGSSSGGTATSASGSPAASASGSGSGTSSGVSSVMNSGGLGLLLGGLGFAFALVV